MINREKIRIFSRRSAGLILAILVVGGLSAFWVMHRTDRNMRGDLIKQARLLAAAVNIDRVLALTGTEADLDSSDYLRIKEQLANARRTNKNCRFIYLMGRLSDGRVFFYADSEPVGSEDESPPGQVFGEISTEYLHAYDAGAELVEGPISDRWGTWVSALIPMTDPKTGDLIAFFGMDITARSWKWSVAAAAILPVVLTLVLLILVIFWIAAAQDRAIATAELAKSEKRFRMIYENAPVLINSFDVNGRCVLWNKHCRGTFGWSFEEINAHDDTLSLLYPDPVVRKEVMQSIIAEPDERFKQRHPKTKDGKTLVTLWANFRLPDGSTISLGYDITDHKQAEEALRKSEGKFRLLADNASDVIWTMDMEWNFTFVSPSVERVFGYSVKQALGKRLEDIMPPESLETILSGFQQAASNADGASEVSAPLTFEVRQYRSDGSLFWTEVNISIIKQSLTSSYYFQGVTRDISERKQAEEAMRDSEERYRLLADNASDNIWVLRLEDLRYTYISPSATKIFGYTHEESMAKEFQEHVTPSSLDILQKVLAEELKKDGDPGVDSKRSRVLELEQYVKGGGTIWTEISATFIRDQGGAPIAILGVTRDITDRLKAKETLRDSEEHYKTLVDTTGDGMAILQDGFIVYVSNRFCEIVDRLSSDIVGSHFSILFAKDKLARIDELHELYISGESDLGVVETEMISPDGSSIGVEINGARYMFEGQESVLISLRDITERKRAEEALQQSEEKYRLMADNVADTIWIVGLSDMRFSYISPAVEKILSYTPAEVLGLGLSAFMTPKSMGKIATTISEELARENEEGAVLNRTRVEELEQVHKDGSIIWTEITARFLRDGDGRPDRILGVTRDITERKQAEEKLREANQIVNTSPAVAFLWKNAEGWPVEFVSDNVKNVFGYSTEDFVAGKVSYTEVVHPEDLEWVSEEVAGFSKEDGRTDFVHEPYRIVAKSGQVKWIDDWTTIRRNESGEITHYQGIVLDVTERKQAEALFQVRADLLEFSVSHSLDELLQKTLDEVCALVNSPVGFYHFVDADQKTLTLQAWSARTEKEFCKTDGKKMHYAIDQAGVWVDCVRERRPVIHNDYASLPYKKGMLEGHLKVVRELIVPIMREDNVVAILGVGNKPNNYLEKEVEIVSYLADVAWEITERKQAEEALWKSESKFRAAFHSTPDAINISRMSDGLYLEINERFLQVMGYEREDVIGLTSQELNIWDNPNEREQFVEMLKTDGYVENLEAAFRRKDGSICHGMMSARLIDFEAKPSILTITRDITDQKWAEEALRESEFNLRQAQHLALLGHYVFNIADGTWTCSEVLEEVFGIDATYSKTIAGWHPIIHPEHQNEMMEYMQNHVVGKGLPFDKEYRIKRISDGQERWVKGLGELKIDMDGHPAEMFGTIQDITDRKKAEEEKEKLEDQLRQAQKMDAVGRLAGGVAHDFNNILTGINGYAEMILNGLDADDSLRPNMEVILSSGKRAAGLTNQLLAFSRKQIIAPRVIQPNDILFNSQKMLRRIIGEDIDFVFAPGSRLWRILADPTQLDQVLMNLAVNARDAMPDGGKLTIETQNVTLDDEYCKSHAGFKPGNYAMLAVTDTGHGMDEETKSKIFEPFFSTKEVGKGTGLGLSMVYGVMKQNKGFINVYSEIDEGTTFKIYYPALEEKAEKPAKDKLADMPAGTETVLLVEDEEIVRNLAKTVLERQGYTVIDAPDGKKAHLEYTQYSGKIDLLLTDVIMPKMNGRELYKKLLDLKPGLKALFMSGYTENAIAHHGVLDKGTHFLQKPFTIQALAKAVRKALDGV